MGLKSAFSRAISARIASGMHVHRRHVTTPCPTRMSSCFNSLRDMVFDDVDRIAGVVSRICVVSTRLRFLCLGNGCDDDEAVSVGYTRTRVFRFFASGDDVDLRPRVFEARAAFAFRSFASRAELYQTLRSLRAVEMISLQRVSMAIKRASLSPRLRVP